jgi:hypothetical protein
LWAALLDRLETHAPAGAVEVDGLWIPTLAELIRVKAYLPSDRRAVRDFIDVCALVRTAGPAAALARQQAAIGAVTPVQRLTMLTTGVSCGIKYTSVPYSCSRRIFDAIPGS